MAFAVILVVLGIVCMPIDKEKNPENSENYVGNEEIQQIDKNDCAEEDFSEEIKEYELPIDENDIKQD